MMPKCESCGTDWTERTLLESEGLGHFFAPNAERTIVEPDGHKWVILFHPNRAVKTVKHCKKCPLTIGMMVADA